MIWQEHVVIAVSELLLQRHLGRCMDIQILTLLLTIFVVVLIPVYYKNYGWQNFLWFSDVGLFITLIAVWMHSSLLISAAVLLTVLLDIAWAIDFFYQLITKKNLLNISGYMFEKKYHVMIRALSLFHLFLPIIWFWCLAQWGFHAQAFLLATVVVWVVMLVTFFFTDPKTNINWVHVPVVFGWAGFPRVLWLVIVMVGYPVVVMFPLSILLKWSF